MGRVGFVARGEVVILPVNYTVDGQDVVFATGAGSKLSCVEVGHYVGFEADSYDTGTRTGWSVVVNGFAEIVDSDEEAARLDGIGMRPWGGAATAPDRVWVRIRPTTVSGRRIPAAPAG